MLFANNSLVNNVVLTNHFTLEKARKLLGVSPKTWQNYRDQRVIPFSQIGRKIYVNRADLNVFLRRHQISARSPDSHSG